MQASEHHWPVVLAVFGIVCNARKGGKMSLPPTATGSLLSAVVLVLDLIAAGRKRHHGERTLFTVPIPQF